jgi:histidinol phosphatase-like PHP family hydrolase
MKFDGIILEDMHNHTSTWSDGRHEPEELIESAVKNGIEIIGITDHYDCDKCRSIKKEKLPDYIKHLNDLKELYKDKIIVKSGIEICMDKSMAVVDDLPYDLFNQLDYVLLEYVDEFPDSVKLPELPEYIRNLKCKVGLAHNDIFHLIEKYRLDQVVKMLKEFNLFFELNCRYSYFYELMENLRTEHVQELLRKLKEKGIPMSVGSDTHYLSTYDIDDIKAANLIANYRYEEVSEIKVQGPKLTVQVVPKNGFIKRILGRR